MFKVTLIKFVFLFLIGISWLIFASIDGTKYFPILSCMSIIISALIGMKISKPRLFNLYRFVLYIFWLLDEIASASIEVTRIIWSSDEEIDPKLVEISTNFSTKEGKLALYANSITLTPGTLSIKATNGNILVHALNDHFAEDLKSGNLEQKIKNL